MRLAVRNRINERVPSNPDGNASWRRTVDESPSLDCLSCLQLNDLRWSLFLDCERVNDWKRPRSHKTQPHVWLLGHAAAEPFGLEGSVRRDHATKNDLTASLLYRP